MSETIRVRYFQMVAAVADIDWMKRAMALGHGDDLIGSAFFDVCGWRGYVPQVHLDAAREQIAQHLNECSKFTWPTLPTSIGGRLAAKGFLNAFDIVPVRIEPDRLWRFGVASRAFDMSVVAGSAS